MKEYSQFKKSHPTIVSGGCISVLILSIFLLFQYFESQVLNLESRWLLVSSIPLLVALVAGGYIKSFKGFGVELEARLEKPISPEALVATEAMSEVTGDEKKTIGYLKGLSTKERRTIKRLVVVQGKRDYYSVHSLKRYFHELRGLSYVEVQDQVGQFVALIPIRVFKIREGDITISNLLEEFINTLETSEISTRYSRVAITAILPEDTELLMALSTMRKERIREIVVVDHAHKFVGLLLKRSIEKKIADSVLNAKECA